MSHIVIGAWRSFIVEWSIVVVDAVIRWFARQDANAAQTRRPPPASTRARWRHGASAVPGRPLVRRRPGDRDRVLRADRDGKPAPAAHVADRRAPVPRLRRRAPRVRPVLPPLRAEAVDAPMTKSQ